MDLDAAAARLRAVMENWRGWAQRLRETGRPAVLWGAGSKGVTFVNLTGLTADGPVDRLVDQNPNKHGRYVARTGQVIVPPENLLEQPADVVVVMNDIYREEIVSWLRANDIRAEVISAMSANG